MTLPEFKHDDMQASDTRSNGTGGGDSFDDAPRRGVPKALKWMAGTAVGLVILAGIGGVVATQMIDQQKYKSLIVSKVQESTGYTVDWEGNISIGMMPLPHASISKLSVKAGDAQILSIAKADIQVALAPLLSQKVEVKNITIDEPVVTLTTSKSGVQTWVAKPKETTAAENSTTSGDSGTSAMDVVVNSIDMKGGSLVIDNQQTGSRQELKNLNLRLRADSLKGPFDLTGDTEWSGQKVAVKATSGEVNIAEGNYPIQTAISIPQSGINLSFSGVVDSKNMGANGDINLEVDDVAKAAKGMTGTAPSLPEGLGGKASLAGKVVYTSSRVAIDDMALALGALSYSGQVAANGLDKNEQPQLSFQLTPKAKASGDAPALIQLLSDLTIAVKGSVENEKVQISTANIKTMGNNISVNGYSTMGANPTVDLTVNASEINLDALTKTTGSAPENSSTAKASSPAMSGNLGFAVPFSGRVRADVAKLTTGGKTYSNIKADVTSKDGGLTITTAEIALPADTSLAVNGQIANTSNLSGLNVQVAAKTQDTEKLFATLGVAMPELPRKVGPASMNGHFNGDLKNLGFSAVLSALQFNLKGEGKVGDPLGTPDIRSLKFNIAHPNFNEAMKMVQPGFSGSSGFFGPLDVSGELAWGTDKVDVTSLNGKLGQTTVAGNISAVTKPKTKISGALNFGAITFPSATNNGGTVEATSKGAAVSSSGGDRWSRDPIDTAWMRSFDADIAIKAKSITQNMWKLSDANLAFKLNDGTLTLDDVSAGLFGGRASINGTVKSGAGAKDPLSINAKLNAENVDAQALMSAATGKVSYTLTGNISKVDVAVNATGSSVANLVQTLGGNGTINGKNIVVKGIDAAQLATAAKGSYKPLDRAGSLFQSFQDGQTEFTDFNSDFTIQSGIVNFSKIYFDGPKATLNTTGNVNLPAWMVNFKNTMTVKETDIPPFDFTIKGPLDNPVNSGGDIINNYLQKKLEKKATKLLEDKLGGKLGALLGGGAAPTTDAAAPEAADDGTTATDPAAATTPEAPVQTQKQKNAQEAVKALQGLFGK